MIPFVYCDEIIVTNIKTTNKKPHSDTIVPNVDGVHCNKIDFTTAGTGLWRTNFYIRVVF